MSKKTIKELKLYFKKMAPVILTEEENQNRPIPRLEIRALETQEIQLPDPMNPTKTIYGTEFISIYGIIRRNVMDEIQFSPFDFTRTYGPDSFDYLDLPGRMGSDMRNDMYELKLPGYFIKPNSVEVVTLEEDLLPWGLKDKIKKNKTNLQ